MIFPSFKPLLWRRMNEKKSIICGFYELLSRLRVDDVLTFYWYFVIFILSKFYILKFFHYFIINSITPFLHLGGADWYLAGLPPYPHQNEMDIIEDYSHLSIMAADFAIFTFVCGVIVEFLLAVPSGQGGFCGHLLRKRGTCKKGKTASAIKRSCGRTFPDSLSFLAYGTPRR